MDRALFSGGPAYAVWNGITFQMHDDWKAELELKDFDVKTNLQGTVGKAISDTSGKVTCQPIAFASTIAATLAALFPYQPDMRGQLIFPSEDLPFVIQTAAGQSITFSAAQITKMPSITFAPDKIFLSTMEFTLLQGNNVAEDASDAFFAIADSAYVEPGMNALDILFALYTMQYGVDPESPFDAIETDESGIKFAPTVKTTERRTNSNGIYNYMIDDVTADVKFTPQNLTETDWAALVPTQGTGYGRGKLRGSLGSLLSIFGNASGLPRLTIPLATGTAGGLEFSQKARTGEVTMTAQRNLTSQTLTTTTTSTSATVVLTSTAGLLPGTQVIGAGIPAGATIVTVTDGTHLLLSAAATASASVAAIYRNPLFALDVVP